MKTAQSPLILLNQFFQSVAAKDARAVAAYFADDIDWYIPKSDLLRWSGRLSHREEITNALQLLFDAHIDGEDQFEIDYMFIDGNEAAVFGNVSRTVKVTGKRFSTPFCQRFTMVNGKITKFLMFEDTLKIEKAFRPEA